MSNQYHNFNSQIESHILFYGHQKCKPDEYFDGTNLRKNDILYYARIMPTLGLYDVYDLKIRTIDEENRWFCGMEKRTKIAYLFSYDNIGKTIFFDRKEALKVVKQAEKNKISVSSETLYEEY